MNMASSNNDLEFLQFLITFSSYKRPGPAASAREFSFSGLPPQPHSGTSRLTTALYQQRLRLQDRVDLQVQDKIHSFKKDLKRRYGLAVQEIHSFVQFVQKFQKELEKIEGQKSDADSAACAWNIERLAKYVDTLQIAFVLPYKPHFKHLAGHGSNTKAVSHQTFASIQAKYTQLAPVCLGVKAPEDLELNQKISFLQLLLTGEFKKGASKIFVQALITPTLMENSLQLRMEERLWLKDLPNSIADYVMYNSSGEALGVVVVKTGGTMKGDSIIHCMLQLLALRTKAANTLFGVVTDAVRFIFIVLTPDGTFQFERDPYGRQQSYYDVMTWKDLHDVTSVFNGLLQLRRRERQSTKH